MSHQSIREMRAAHRVLAEMKFDRQELSHGYAGRWLRVDLSNNRIELRPVTQQMKDLFTGGKGFDLWLTLHEVGKETRWDSPENPICFSSGPLGGTMSFPGSGKTLVTAISPSTHSMMDCNVGGFFGPYLKFAGFDALMVIGKAGEEVVVVIDAVQRRVSIEAAPRESIDSHVVAEELTEMYADSEPDKRNIAVVSAGRAAEYTRLGVLNFSFWDWRRRVPRLKQAGRGGIGTVFRNKRVKALVLKNRGITPGWRITESEAQRRVDSRLPGSGPCSGQLVAEVVARHGADKARVVPMLQDIRNAAGPVTADVVKQVGLMTGVPERELFHAATFYGLTDAASEGEPRPASAVAGMAAFATAQLFGNGELPLPRRESWKRFLAPGSMRSVEKLHAEKGEALTAQEVFAGLGGNGAWDPASLFEGCCPGSLIESLAEKSCGACTPCREGLHVCAELLGKPVTEETAAVVRDVTDLMTAACQCNFGRSAGKAVAAVMADGGPAGNDCCSEGKEVK